jgi:hypothetical protein
VFAPVTSYYRDKKVVGRSSFFVALQFSDNLVVENCLQNCLQTNQNMKLEDQGIGDAGDQANYRLSKYRD